MNEDYEYDDEYRKIFDKADKENLNNSPRLIQLI